MCLRVPRRRVFMWTSSKFVTSDLFNHFYVITHEFFMFSFSGVQDCRQERNCHMDATCRFDDEEGRFLCLCNHGFIGNGLGTYQGQRLICHFQWWIESTFTILQFVDSKRNRIAWFKKISVHPMQNVFKVVKSIIVNVFLGTKGMARNVSLRTRIHPNAFLVYVFAQEKKFMTDSNVFLILSRTRPYQWL